MTLIPHRSRKVVFGKNGEEIAVALNKSAETAMPDYLHLWERYF